jgi:hypothetical protein
MKKSDKDRPYLFDRKVARLLDDMTARHRRVLPVRVDFTFPQGYRHNGGNTEIRRLHKRLAQHYRDRGTDVGYHTARQQASSENPHYHSLIVVDGDHVQSPESVQKCCNKIWKDIVNDDRDGLVDFCVSESGQPLDPLRMIPRPSSKAADAELVAQKRKYEAAKDLVLLRANYFNKPKAMGKAPYRMREVFTSQVRKKKR